jgi:hypothetical protein
MRVISVYSKSQGGPGLDSFGLDDGDAEGVAKIGNAGVLSFNDNCQNLYLPRETKIEKCPI